MKKKLVALCMAVSFVLTACGSKVDVQEPATEAMAETEAEEESEPTVTTEETVSEAEEVTTEVSTETQEETEVESASDFMKGKVSDAGWESEWLGMRYVPVDGMVMSTEEELNALMGVSMEMLSEDFNEIQLKFAELNTVYEMMCTAADKVSNVNLSLEKLPIKMDIDTYIDVVKTQLSGLTEMAITVTNEGEDVVVAGKDFKKLQSEVAYDGITLYQDYYMAMVEDRVIIIVVSYIDEAAADNLMSCFQAY